MKRALRPGGTAGLTRAGHRRQALGADHGVPTAAMPRRHDRERIAENAQYGKTDITQLRNFRHAASKPFG
jgi:hypothetical protein